MKWKVELRWHIIIKSHSPLYYQSKNKLRELLLEFNRGLFHVIELHFERAVVKVAHGHGQGKHFGIKKRMTFD